MEAAFDTRSPDDVRAYLSKEVPNLDGEVLNNFVKHKICKICGAVFLELTDEYLRELIPLLGDRIQVKRAIMKAMDSTEQVCLHLVSNSCELLCSILFLYLVPPCYLKSF